MPQAEKAMEATYELDESARAVLMAPAVPHGPLPPRMREWTPDQRAGLDKQDAQLVRGLVAAMVWGETAADQCRRLSAVFWRQADARPGPAPMLRETLAWLAALGGTENTPEGIVTLLRLADLIECWSTNAVLGTRER